MGGWRQKTMEESKEPGGLGGGWRMYGDEGKRVNGILNQVDERREQR